MSGAEIGLILAQHFLRCIIRTLSACILVTHREGNSMGGSPLFNAGIQNQRGCCEVLA